LRAIGEPTERFAEDHLRLLRAVRFAARFGLEIERETSVAMSSHAEKLKSVSPERIADELRFMLTPTTRIRAWELLWRFHLIQVIFRTLPEKSSRPTAPDRGNAPLFPQLAPEHTVSFGLALAAMALCYRTSASNDSPLRLLEVQEARRLARACHAALRISNDELELVTGVVHLAPMLRENPPGVATMKRFLAKGHSIDARQMLDALARSDYMLAPRIGWLLQQFHRFEQEGQVAPAPLLTGDDLVAVGWMPGPVFKRVLDQVYDAQLEDRIATKQQALELAEQLKAQSK
jgi:poly(A) polymerase